MSTLHEICGYILHNFELHETSNFHAFICGDFNASWSNIEHDNRLNQFKEIIGLYELYLASELYSGVAMYTSFVLPEMYSLG